MCGLHVKLLYQEENQDKVLAKNISLFKPLFSIAQCAYEANSTNVPVYLTWLDFGIFNQV